MQCQYYFFTHKNTKAESLFETQPLRRVKKKGVVDLEIRRFQDSIYLKNGSSGILLRKLPSIFGEVNSVHRRDMHHTYPHSVRTAGLFPTAKKQKNMK